MGTLYIALLGPSWLRQLRPSSCLYINGLGPSPLLSIYLSLQEEPWECGDIAVKIYASSPLSLPMNDVITTPFFSLSFFIAAQWFPPQGWRSLKQVPNLPSFLHSPNSTLSSAPTGRWPFSMMDRTASCTSRAHPSSFHESRSLCTSRVTSAPP